MDPVIDHTIKEFTSYFGEPPTNGAMAPGRLEILGNHTDYNGGYVMAAALDRVTAVVGRRTEDGKISLCASDLDRFVELDAAQLGRDTSNTWADYLIGVVYQLRASGAEVGGFQAAIHSTVPNGTGLSSSAALEVATALLLQSLFGLQMDRMETAKLCQRAENQYVGVNSGLLDQFSSMFGVRDAFVYLDCLTFEHGSTRLGNSNLELVVCDSMRRHELTGGDYNTRRKECMAAASFFGKKLLREVTLEEFDACKAGLPENERKRAQHILEENQRVLKAIGASAAGDIAGLGKLMTASHQSSRLLFENSTPELDFLVDTAISVPGCLGARLTGGGWGGATVNLVEAEYRPEFALRLGQAYRAHTGIEPNVFVSRIAAGASSVEIKQEN